MCNTIRGRKRIRNIIRGGKRIRNTIRGGNKPSGMQIIRDVRRVWHKEQEYNPQNTDTGNIKTGATKPEL